MNLDKFDRLAIGQILIGVGLAVLLVLNVMVIKEFGSQSRARAPRTAIEALCTRIVEARKGRGLEGQVVEVDGKFLCLVGDPRISRYEIAAVIDKRDVVVEDTR